MSTDTMNVPGSTVVPDTTVEEQPSVTDRLFDAALGALDWFTIYLGDSLGIYRALADGPDTSRGFSTRLDLDERYMREWLEQQAVSGFLTCTGDDAGRTFALAPGVAEALLDETNMEYIGAVGLFVVAIGGVLNKIEEAFKTGEGVPWEAYGSEMTLGQASFNHAPFVNLLASEWIPAVPALHKRLLDADNPAYVADIACGAGWSSIELAKAYSAIRVIGLDVDERAIALARRNAAEEGVSDRVQFEVDAVDVECPERDVYDAAFIFEALHDFGRPVEVLRNGRNSIKPGGHLFVMDERADEAFSASGDPVQRLLYGASVLVCLPNGRAGIPDSAATGTVMRPSTLQHYAKEAGLKPFDVLDIEHPMFRFYCTTI